VARIASDKIYYVNFDINLFISIFFHVPLLPPVTHPSLRNYYFPKHESFEIRNSAIATTSRNQSLPNR
jgi:hypothetical protein